MAEKKTVLIIDDKVVAESYSDPLKEYSEFDVHVVHDLGEAIRLIQRIDFDVDVIVAEHFLDYGVASRLLEGGTDPHMWKGAARLFAFVRKYYPRKTQFVLLGSDADYLKETRDKFDIPVNRVFLKPFSTFVFEYMVCQLCGVTCRVPEWIIKEEMTVGRLGDVRF
ncbi:TPA: hypothetical protein DF272_00685 [Candidatus Falkowbacteria bacterium]|nr:hypothetical protein [Candidatus Falkowbacteria bacterium]